VYENGQFSIASGPDADSLDDYRSSTLRPFSKVARRTL
jgi:hypothetical protein